MRKICFVIYNRANYGRIKGLLYLLKNQKNINLKIVLASSSILKKYGSLDEILKKDGFKIDYKFYSHLEGENKYTMTKSSVYRYNFFDSPFIHIIESKFFLKQYPKS